MKKVVSILLALIMCGTFIVGASAICYEEYGVTFSGETVAS